MMDPESLGRRLDALCKELGLERSASARIVAEAQAIGKSALQGHAALPEEVERLRAEAEAARAERDRLAKKEEEIMKLLGSESPETILHDLRNILNDLTLLQEVNGEPRTPQVRRPQ